LPTAKRHLKMLTATPEANMRAAIRPGLPASAARGGPLGRTTAASEKPPDAVLHGRGRGEGVDGVSTTSCRRDPGPRGRERLRQERQRPLDPPPDPNPPGKIVGGEIFFEGEECSRWTRTSPPYPRQQDRDDLPGADDVPQPSAHDRPAAHGDPRTAPEDGQAGRGLPRHRAAGDGRHPEAKSRINDYPHQFSAACASA